MKVKSTNLFKKFRLKKVIFFFLAILFVGALAMSRPTISFAQAQTATPLAQFYRAKVIRVVSESQIPDPNSEKFLYAQMLEVQRLDNSQVIQVQRGNEFQPLSEKQRYQVGTDVVISQQQITPDQTEWVITDTYRLNGMAWLAIGFFILVLIVGHRQGALAIIGMFLSLAVLMFFIVPQIIAGQNPVLISLIGSGMVAVITIYLCHGVRTESHIALLSLCLTLLAVGLLSTVAVQLVHLAGLGSEEASFLQFGSTAKINLQGLLLGGIMIGALGVLDDITIAQVSVVNQLKEAKPQIHFHELYARALVVGKDHVASLVNTLVLAYAASSLPLFLLFSTYTAQPTWVTLNSEIIAEEVVRTLTGSIGLVLAVPLTTMIATYFAIRKKAHLGLLRH